MVESAKSKYKDGRRQSQELEDKLLSLLKKRFVRIRIPRAREWFDFSCNASDGQTFFPINIKFTTGKTDNLSCKLGLYYTLTGKRPSFENEIEWEGLFEKIRINLGTKRSKDYFFLVIFKNTGTCLITSLRSLTNLRPNGNNLPFQCRWNSQIGYSPNPFNRSRSYLLTTLGKSVNLRAAIKEQFQSAFPGVAT